MVPDLAGTLCAGEYAKNNKQSRNQPKLYENFP